MTNGSRTRGARFVSRTPGNEGNIMNVLRGNATAAARVPVAFAWPADFAFVAGVFALGRTLTLLAFAVAPHLRAPNNGISPVAGWAIFTHWDGVWFRDIATHGYEYARDGGQHSVAFFPLYPAIVALAVHVGFAFAPAATIASNAFFLAMLVVAYGWTRERHGVVVARFTVATLALLPVSIFGSVAYSESLFLLLTTLALRDADRGHRLRAGMWAALASATRLAGLGLAFAFVLDALRRRNDLRAWLAAAIAPLGAVAYIAYQQFRFGDALAFVHTQVGWRKLGFTSTAWPETFASRLVSHHHWVAVLAFAAAAVVYARFRTRLGAPGEIAAAILTVLVWGRLWGVEDNMKLLFLFVGAYAVVRFRRHFTLIELAYATAVYALVLAAWDPISVDRYIWGVLPFSIALAYLWQRYPKLGFATLAFGSLELVVWSLRFAQDVFVG